MKNVTKKKERLAHPENSVETEGCAGRDTQTRQTEREEQD
jgi:hypothetical protein